jgi:hypothetical protein
MIAGAFVGTVLALGINAGAASAFEPTSAVKVVQVSFDEEGSRSDFPVMASRSGIRW